MAESKLVTFYGFKTALISMGTNMVSEDQHPNHPFPLKLVKAETNETLTGIELDFIYLLKCTYELRFNKDLQEFRFDEAVLFG